MKPPSTGLLIRTEAENISEELLIDDSSTETEHPMIWKVDDRGIEFKELENFLLKIEKGLEENNYPIVLKVLENTVAGFVPDNDLVDPLLEQ